MVNHNKYQTRQQSVANMWSYSLPDTKQEW